MRLSARRESTGLWEDCGGTRRYWEPPSESSESLALGDSSRNVRGGAGDGGGVNMTLAVAL